MTEDVNTEKALIAAQRKAAQLFAETEKRGLIKAGISEKDLNTQVYILAQEILGIKKYWHKRLVRAGINALCPYEENPPNLIIQEDDLVFLDFGPVFEDYEADFGRTYQLGSDPEKRRIIEDLPLIFAQCKKYFNQNLQLTSAQFYQYVVERSQDRGWLYGGPHAGHLIGVFPHEKLLGDGDENYICAANNNVMRDLDINGNRRHWILEIHLIDQNRRFGAFYEELLTI